MKVKLLFFITFSISYFSNAQAPSGYYDSANGLVGDDLREALHQIIKGHSSKDYDDLWNYFNDTDKKSNGKVWDMYSDGASYEHTFSTDQCGNYSGEGDCYNREHSFPKSWYGDASPMNSDLFHVYPTDGWVNGKRDNYPYGEVGSASWTSENGSKVGSSSTSGYSGTVFEPIDTYKGDFARTYFYMVTRYKDIASGWSGDMLTGNDLSSWAIDLLLVWDEADPVSQKEIDRNNEIYSIQNNRNPYIDNPDYVDYVWGGEVSNVILNKINTLTVNYENDALKINCECSVISVKIYSVIGEEVYFSNHNVKQTIPLNLPKGLYIANINGVGKRFIAY